MMDSVLFFAALAWAAPVPQDAPGSKEIVQTSRDPNYKVTIPKGFVRTAPRESGYSFERPAGSADWEKVRVDLIPLSETLAIKQAPPFDAMIKEVSLSDPREVKQIRLPWENLEIDGVVCRWSHQGVDQAARVAWVPTWPKATAVCVSAPTTLVAELTADLMIVLNSFQGRTQWLTPEEEQALVHYRWPGFGVPILSGLFLVTWALFFRGHPAAAHGLRLTWHIAVPVVAAVAYYFLNRSAGAREKMGIEAPLYLWFLMIGPLTLFHMVMVVHRVRTAVEMGD